MFTEQFFALLLAFGDEWAVKEVTTNLETNEVEIYVEYFGSAKIYDYAPARRWRHLDTMQFQTFLNCRLPRVKLENGQVNTMPPPWANKHDRHSHLFESAVISLLLATKNQTQTANLMRCNFALVNRILHAATKRGLARRSTETVFENLSIDEKAFHKGHRYATILSDPETGCVLEVAETRTKQACQGLLDKALTPAQQEAVTTLSMDLWQAYIAVAEEQLPQAQIVHDKFHLVKYLTEAIDKVRRREVKQHAELKNSRYALLKNEANLTAKQRVKFAEIRAANYEVSRAWAARENFRDVFQHATLEESEAIFAQWSQAGTESGIKEVMKVARMFSNHLRGVLNALTSKLSNALAERLNGKIQLLKSIGRGYRKFENFRSAILFFYGNFEFVSTKFPVEPLNSKQNVSRGTLVLGFVA